MNTPKTPTAEPLAPLTGSAFAIGDRVRYHKTGHHHLKDTGIVTGFTTDRVRVEVEHSEGLYWPENLRKLNDKLTRDAGEKDL